MTACSTLYPSLSHITSKDMTTLKLLYLGWSHLMNQKGPISSWHFKSLNTVPHLEPSWRITYEMSSFHKVTLNGMTLDLSQLIVRNAGTLMKLLRSKSTFAPSNRFPSLLEVVKPVDSHFSLDISPAPFAQETHLGVLATDSLSL